MIAIQSLQRRVLRIMRAPSYNPRLFDADVALLQMDRPVRMSNIISPICVPDEETFGGGDDYSVDQARFSAEAVTIGWGKNASKSNGPSYRGTTPPPPLTLPPPPPLLLLFAS